MATSGSAGRTTAGSSSVLKGVLIAVVAMVFFSSVHSAVRELSDTMSAFQIVFWRMSVSVLLMMPFYLWKGFHHLKTRRLKMHVHRSALNFIGMVLWFHAISIVPLGKAVAIHFTLPLFVLILAAIVLHEKVGPRRIVATVIGFSGMLVILRPGVEAVGWPEAMILGSAALYGANVIYLKFMVGSETPLSITFYTNALICLFCIPPAIWYWQPTTVDDIIPIALIGIMGTVAPWMFTVALRSTDASVIAPIDFLRLPFTVTFAFIFFGEVPEIWVWIGGAIIFLSTWYITARESQLARRKAAVARPSEDDA